MSTLGCSSERLRSYQSQAKHHRLPEDLGEARVGAAYSTAWAWPIQVLLPWVTSSPHLQGCDQTHSGTDSSPAGPRAASRAAAPGPAQTILSSSRVDYCSHNTSRGTSLGSAQTVVPKGDDTNSLPAYSSHKALRGTSARLCADCSSPVELGSTRSRTTAPTMHWEALPPECADYSSQRPWDRLAPGLSREQCYVPWAGSNCSEAWRPGALLRVRFAARSVSRTAGRPQAPACVVATTLGEPVSPRGSAGTVSEPRARPGSARPPPCARQLPLPGSKKHTHPSPQDCRRRKVRQTAIAPAFALACEASPRDLPTPAQPPRRPRDTCGGTVSSPASSRGALGLARTATPSGWRGPGRGTASPGAQDCAPLSCLHARKQCLCTHASLLSRCQRPQCHLPAAGDVARPEAR